MPEIPASYSADAGSRSHTPIVFYVMDAFIHALIYIQIWVKKVEDNGGYQNFNTKLWISIFMTFIWISKNLFFLSHLCYECEMFYLKVEEANMICSLIMKTEEKSGVVKKSCKNVLRMNKIAFKKMEACGFFVVASKLPLNLLSLIATYVIVLLQFSLERLYG